MAEVVPDARELLPEDTHQRRAEHVRAARVAAEREVPEAQEVLGSREGEGAARRSRAMGHIAQSQSVQCQASILR